MATDRDGANLGKANLHGASLVGALTIRDLLGHKSNHYHRSFVWVDGGHERERTFLWFWLYA